MQIKKLFLSNTTLFRKFKNFLIPTFMHKANLVHNQTIIRLSAKTHNNSLKKICFLCFLLFSMAVLLFSPLSAREEISFATLAPKSSSWGKLITEFVREVYKQTDKKVLLRVYYGGVQGDEAEVEKKIRFGQLEGGFFTGNGLGSVAFEARVLELPGMLTTYKQVDNVYAGIEKDLNVYFQKNGYELLGLIDVGYAYFFSKEKIPTHESIRSTKMWVWKGDQLAGKLMNVLNIPAVSVDFTEVIPSLQTGLINGVYATPTALISLEWQKEINFMQSLPVTLVSSGIVLSKKRFDSLPNDTQNELKTSAAKVLTKYKPILRKSDETTLKLLDQRGIEVFNNNSERSSLKKKGDALKALFPNQLVKKLETLTK